MDRADPASAFSGNKCYTRGGDDWMIAFRAIDLIIVDLLEIDLARRTMYIVRVRRIARIARS